MPRSKDPLAPIPAPQPTREDSRDIVEAIVSAAMQLADPEVTMEAIAARAGVGIASLYRYFPSRAAIYAEISRRLHRKFLAQLREVLAKPSESLDAVILDVCRVVVEGPGVGRELRRSLNAAVPLSWSQESANEVYRTAMVEILEWLEQHLDPVPTDLRERVFVAFSSVRGAVMMSMLFPDLAPPFDALIQHMARGVLAQLVHSGEAPRVHSHG